MRYNTIEYNIWRWLKLKKIIRLVLLVGIVAFAATIASRFNSIMSQMCAMVLSAICGCLIAPIGEFIDTKGQGIKVWYQSQVKYRNKDVYLSFAYLYKIEIDGKFLFIRGNRLKDRYQPIGGVYKYYEEAKDFLRSIQALPSVKMQNEEDSDDLRLTIKGKHYLAFYEWFVSMINREFDPRREFFEELVKPGIIPGETFESFKYSRNHTHNVGFTYSTPLQMPEVIYADVFELKLNSEQKNVLRTAVNENPELLCLATSDEIKCRRVNGAIEMNLGNNALWIIGEE